MKHGFGQLIIGIIGIVIAVILVSSVAMPIVTSVNRTTFLNASNTSAGSYGYSAAEWAMWPIVGLVLIAGLILLVVNAFM